MNINNLSGLPDWDDEHMKMFDNHDEEEWKPNPTRAACKALYLQWQQVMVLLNGLFETMNVEEKENGFPPDYWEDHKQMILGDALQVGAKILSSEAGNIYCLRMENAAIIRKNAQFIKSSMLQMMGEVIDEQHGEIVRDEIDKFRLLFIDWVATFEKDEFKDEWGLFI